MRRRKVLNISLVLITSGLVKACSNNSTNRNVYRNLNDCASDWDAAGNCDPVTDGSYPSGYYYSPHYRYINGTPHYYSADGRLRPVSSNAGILKNSGSNSSKAVGTVRRGGFGSTGRFGGGSKGS